MGLLRVFSYRSQSEAVVVVDEKAVAPTVEQSADADRNAEIPEVAAEEPVSAPAVADKPDALGAAQPAIPAVAVEASVPAADVPLPLSPTTSVDGDHPHRKRRISLRPFSRPRVHEEHKHTLSVIQEQEKKADATVALSKNLLFSSSSDRKAKESAEVVRALIVGNGSASPEVTRAVAKPQLSKVKSQLMKPKSANKVIAHLRELSVEGGHTHGAHAESNTPIHAVCLEHPDAKEHELHFAHLYSPAPGHSPSASTLFFPSFATAPVEKLSEVLSQMKLIDLVKSPDLGLGQPGDGVGILAGAVPTAETVLNGIQQITPQLLALGYATGKAITPDHKGVYPPTDRMSVLTYWWGLEIALPPPTLAYLSNVHSISGTVVNFLSALAMVNNGVREILPFVRYISQFIDFEFNAIKAQNKGSGVVCAATWIMPAAMVPRPWDFPSPPPPPPSQVTEDAIEKGTAEATGPRVGKGEDGLTTQPAMVDGIPSLPSPSPSPPSSPSIPVNEPLRLPAFPLMGTDVVGRHAPLTPMV